MMMSYTWWQESPVSLSIQKLQRVGFSDPNRTPSPPTPTAKFAMLLLTPKQYCCSRQGSRPILPFLSFLLSSSSFKKNFFARFYSVFQAGVELTLSSRLALNSQWPAISGSWKLGLQVSSHTQLKPATERRHRCTTADGKFCADRPCGSLLRRSIRRDDRMKPFLDSAFMGDSMCGKKL